MVPSRIQSVRVSAMVSILITLLMCTRILRLLSLTWVRSSPASAPIYGRLSSGFEGLDVGKKMRVSLCARMRTGGYSLQANRQTSCSHTSTGVNPDRDQ